MPRAKRTWIPEEVEKVDFYLLQLLLSNERSRCLVLSLL
jgi:hypothetical protein